MNKRFLGAGLAVALALGGLLYSAVSSTAKAVVTVESLLDAPSDRAQIRLGARVADLPIDYSTSPSFLLRFQVHDIKHPGGTIPVVYHGIMPDTLKAGRDVILEGDFKAGQFEASSLLTQCPSKYEVPDGPGGVKSEAGKSGV